MTNISTPAQYFLILLDLVESQGYLRDDLLQNTSLAQSGLVGIGARVSEPDFNTLVRNATALTGDNSLGLQLGLRMNFSAHAVLGQAFMTCQNLNQVMELFLKYYHLLAPDLQLDFKISGDHCLLKTISPARDEHLVFMYEQMFGAVHNTVSDLLDLGQLELRIEAPYPPPPHANLYYEAFGDDVHFDCLIGGISFHRDLLDQPLATSNPALRTLYEQECARLLVDLEGESATAEQTLQLLRKLEGQYPQMPQIARMLNYSSRTFRRRLQREGHSFQDLLDQVRAEHATRYLQRTRLPLSTIAYMVGFNDASNFRRAYIKWTGVSPQQLRGDDS